MARLFYRARISRLLGDWGLIKPRSRIDRSIEMEQISDLLHHTERQLNRARVQHLCEIISLRQLESLWQHKVQEVGQLLHKAPIEASSLSTWSRQRVTHAIGNWEQMVHAISQRSLQVMDFCNLQGALEEVAKAFFICARVKRDHAA